jgi:thiol-disulfide isomerase/thioredoxin
MRISWLKYLLIFLFLAWVSLCIGLLPAYADSQSVDIYFYHSKTCPHCLKQKPLMEAIAKENPQIKIHAYEVHEKTQDWQKFLQQYQLPNGAVPRTLVGDKIFVGYTEESGELEYIPTHKSYLGYQNQIIKAIEDLVEKPLIISGKQIKPPPSPAWSVFLIVVIYGLTYLPLKSKNSTFKQYWWAGFCSLVILSLFGFLLLTPDTLIKQFAESLPFPLFVATIALADGFNPCAFTVLIILLSLLTYSKSRQDMALIGSTFIATSGIMYFVFILLMMAIGSLFLERWGNVFLTLLGGIITIAGIINLKDYFWFKQGLSLSLSENQQRIISQRAGQISRHLREAGNSQRLFGAALGGTILLAIFVNVVELGCTAILPVVYLTALVHYCQANFWLCAAFWTGIYAVIYILPLLAILGNFIYFFKSSRLTEKQGRILKLVSGLFMVFFGVIMIIRPELLQFG